MEEPKYCVAFTADDRFCSLCNQGKGCVELAKNYKNKIPTMSKEEGKPDLLDPCDIAEKIFYSPATNGKAEESLEKAVDLIRAYAKQELSELKKENEELKDDRHGAAINNELLEHQLIEAKRLLTKSLFYIPFYQFELTNEIELFLKS